MNAKFFGGPRDGQWIDLPEDATREIWVPAVVLGIIWRHRYWRYGNRLVWADATAMGSV